MCLALISSPFVVAFEQHEMKDEEIAANKCCCRSHLVVAVAIA
jgi:hypothetical protein